MARANKYLYYCVSGGTQYSVPLYTNTDCFSSMPGYNKNLRVNTYYLPLSINCLCFVSTSKIHVNNLCVPNGFYNCVWKSSASYISGLSAVNCGEAKWIAPNTVICISTGTTSKTCQSRLNLDSGWKSYRDINISRENTSNTMEYFTCSYINGNIKAYNGVACIYTSGNRSSNPSVCLYGFGRNNSDINIYLKCIYVSQYCYQGYIKSEY